MFSEQELADLERCVDVLEYELTNDLAHLNPSNAPTYPIIRDWILEVQQVVQRAKKAIEREKNRE